MIKQLFIKLKIYGLRKFLLFLFYEIKNKIWLEFVHGSYSQHGEDLIIDKILGYKKKGFYVDIGAYDPHRFSNTKRFYLRGWHGINVEPNCVNFRKFTRERKRDINLNIGVGNSNSKLTFYQFIPDTLSTFSEKEANNYLKHGYKLISKKKVNVQKLSAILQKYFVNKSIDFISIDTEGYEMEVLKSNDWKKYKPKLFCIETNTGKSHIVETYLKHKGYTEVFRNKVNSVYLYE